MFNDGVGAVRYRVERWLRSTVRSSALLVVVIALFAAVPLALAAGARRTATAPERFDESSGLTADVLAHQDEGPVVAGTLAELPAVRAVEGATFMFGGLTAAGGADLSEHIVFAGSATVFGDPLVEGRHPDPDVPGEFVVPKPFAESNHLAVGDVVRLKTKSAEQIAETGFNDLADTRITEATLVGLTDGPADLNEPLDVAVFSPALLDDELIGTSGSFFGIDLADGATVEQLRQQLSSVPGGELLRLEPAGFVSTDTRRAVGAQTAGLWVLAGFTAVATVAALGQLLLRHTRLTDDETSILSSLGASRGHRAGETTAAPRRHRGRHRRATRGRCGGGCLGHLPLRLRPPSRAPSRIRLRPPRAVRRRARARIRPRRLGRAGHAVPTIDVG